MKEARLGDVVASMKNGIYKPASAYAENGTPCLRMYNIDAGSIVWRDIKRMKVTPAEQADYGLLEGDLLVNRVNSRELVGKTAVIPAGMEPSVFESKNIRVRLDTAKALPKFINYQLFARGSRHFANNAQQVVGMASISQGQLADFPIVLTDLDEQRRIVAEIEKQFSRLDEAVANLQRVKANLKRYKASVLKAAVEGSLVETEASIAQREGRSYETGEQLLQRILEERRRKWTGKGKYKEATPPVEVDGLHVPEGWGIGSAEQVCSSVRDGTHDTPDYVAIGVPLITSKNLDEHGIDFENVKFISEQDHAEISKRSSVSGGDILFAMIGTIGNPCEVKTDTRFSIKNVALFKANSEFLHPTYFCYWLQSSPLNKWLEPRLKGTTQKFAPLGLLRELPTALPPFAEQVRIVAEVDRHLSILREVEAEIDTNLQRAQALRQATLAKAFSAN